jgi:hypothetical protein
VIDSHPVLDAAVHAQPLFTVTVTEPFVAVTGIESVDGDNVYTHAT